MDTDRVIECSVKSTDQQTITIILPKMLFHPFHPIDNLLTHKYLIAQGYQKTYHPHLTHISP